MKLTKSQLKQLIYEELVHLEMFDTGSAGEPAGAMSNAEKKVQCEKKGGTWVEGVGCKGLQENDPMQRGADLHKILYEISQDMEDKGIYEPKAGIEAWLGDPDNVGKVSEEDVKALYDMSDEIYDYM